MANLWCALLLSAAVLLASVQALSRFTGRETAGQVRFDAHSLLQVLVPSKEHLDRLDRLYQDEDLFIDLWSDLKIGSVETLVPRSSLPKLKEAGLGYLVIAEDVQQAIDERNLRREARTLQERRPTLNSTWFTEHHDLDEIKAWMNEIVAAYPTLASKVVIGRSFLGEEIEALRITGGRASKAIVYHGGQHSNEWIGVAVTSYIIFQLVSGYGSDAEITRLVDGYEWTIAPVLNVDGYRYTWTTNSGWRKNRQPNAGSDCIGIDTNRNWPYKWNTGGSSSAPCSNNYHGPEPFFSPEPKSVSDYIELLQRSGKEVLSYIDWHCCGLMWMNPWGYTCDDVPAADVAQKRAGNIAVDAARAVHGVSYEMGNICNVIYLASGSSADHVYGNLNVTYSFALELRSGTQFNPNLIIPNGEEMWAGVKAYTLALL